MVIYFLIIIVLLFAVLFLLIKNKNANGGLFRYNQERKKMKEKHKEKIMEMLKKNGMITNQEVEKSLDVSNTTTKTYLDELEHEGKIVQNAKSVETYYTLK